MYPKEKQKDKIQAIELKLCPRRHNLLPTSLEK